MDHKSRKLPGNSERSRFKVSGYDGGKSNESYSIFPIIKRGTAKYCDLVGTGFYISSKGLFVTARHVVMDVIDEASKESTQPISLIHWVSDNEYYLREIVAVSVPKNRFDLATGMAQQMAHNISGDLLQAVPLKMSLQSPSVGDQVFTYAYPDTIIERTGDNAVHVYVNAEYYEGTVIETFPDGRDKYLLPNPCFRTDIHLHPGSSGGPVFNSKGYVIGVNSTSFQEAPDVSFVSNINYVLDLNVPNGRIEKEPNLSPVRVKDLVRYGYLSVG